VSPTAYQREMLKQLAAAKDGDGVLRPRDSSQPAGANFTVAVDEMVQFGWIELVGQPLKNSMVGGDLYYALHVRITPSGRDVLQRGE
jgi:hypothetical protein